MKSTTLTCVAAITLFTVALPVPMAAQHTRYKLIDIGTLGGPTSVVGSFTQSVDNRGIVIGAADTAIPDPYDPNCSVVNPELEDCLVQHAFQWQKGVLAIWVRFQESTAVSRAG